jgi:quercetin dioxygenase-like cupin family protein
VLSGKAEVWMDGERSTLSDGQLAIIPAGRKHGFINVGSGLLHIRSTLASPVFEAAYDDKRETPRRWLPT